jgi:glyoxylase-like metal-dependent hydrolase (beta-lactamase superfamily II)
MGSMDTIIPHLHATSPAGLSFAPSLAIRAYLLERKAGNLLVYGAPVSDDDAAAIERLGGVTRQYFNHWHEAMSEPFGPPLYVHAADAPAVREHRVAGPFSDRSVLDGDFELIPTPGHTAGATAFLWDSGEHRCLFTGDTIYLRDGEWVAALDVRGSDRDSYVDTLELIRELDFDMLVPWAATATGPAHAMTNATDTARRIDAILERVARGEAA